MSIVEIARKFAVSPVTVSNALNHRKGVAPKLAEEICTYARKVGYQPNHLARSLLSGRTGVVGVCLCVPPSTPWFCNLLCQLQHRLSEEGYYANTIVIDPTESNDGVKRELWALNFFRQIKTEAILLGPLDNEHFTQMHYDLEGSPKLVVFDALDDLPVPYVGLDMIGSCRDAMAYLYRAGHRKIGYLGLNRFDAVSPSCHTRYSGYRKFLTEYGLEFRESQVIHTPRLLPEPAMVEDLKQLLTGPEQERPTAFFCHDDSFAMLAYKAAAECGIRIPEDLSLISFDNQPCAWLCHPGLNSFYFDLTSYVDHLLKITLAQLTMSAGSDPDLFRHRETVLLAERGSVAVLPEKRH